MREDGAKSQIEGAKESVSQQLQQVQNFIGQGMDAIIADPVDTSAAKPITGQVTEARIPLMFMNRRPQAELTGKMVYVGPDSIPAGYLRMKALARAMSGKGNVVILLDGLSNESARDHTRGVEEVVVECPNTRIIRKQIAKLTRDDTADVVSNWVTSDEDVQATVSSNDEMTIGVLQVLGKNPDRTLIAGVGGTPDTLRTLENDKMITTIFQDAEGQGEDVVDAAIKLVDDEKAEKIIDVPYQLTTEENMAKFTSRSQKWSRPVRDTEVGV